ncbi:MAG TPA: MraY family glycosyltransferase [Cyclobacteriaceae bacterium]|nr:MraY family glycosyltransferase [Cyclobacteriaceae bacterium]
MEAYLIIIYVATAFTITFLFLPVLIKLLSGWKIFDSPGKHKIHSQYTPSMGGVCILMGAVFAQLIGLQLTDWVHFRFLYITIAMMFITGLRDDILTLTPRQKLIGQLLPVVIMVVFGETTLWSFYGSAFEGLVFPDIVAWGVTIFTVVILTNGYNLIDGLDGLAGTVGTISLICFGVWFYRANDFSTALISLSFAGALIAFLYFNWEPSRIFMGDTGALVLGLLLSYLTIRFINANYLLPPDSPIHFSSSIGTAILVIIIPVFDTLRVIILRLRKFQSPFKADKNHLHHQFLKLGFSHAKSVTIIAGIHLFFVILALALKNSPDTVILPAAIAGCIIINQAIKTAQKRYERNGGKSLITEK